MADNKKRKVRVVPSWVKLISKEVCFIFKFTKKKFSWEWI